MVNADQFHPMRGDVFDGQQIQFVDRVLALHNVMRGWVLRDENGKQVGDVLPSANDVAVAVHQMNRRSIGD